MGRDRRRGLINSALQGMGIIQQPLEMLYSFEAVAVALLTILLPYAVTSIANAIDGIDRRFFEAAQSLGAGPVRTFLTVTWPLSAPGVASGLSIVFLLMLSAYVTITLVGGARLKLLVSSVYDYSTNLNWPASAAAAFVLLAIGLAGRPSYSPCSGPAASRASNEIAALAPPIALIALLGLVIAVAPIAVVIVISFSADALLRFPPSGFSLRWFAAFFGNVTMQRAFLLSLQLATDASCLATILATMAALGAAQIKGRRAAYFQMLFFAPMVFPTIILGLALLLYFRQVGVPDFWGLLCAHVVITIPYAFRLVFAQLQSLDTALHEASQSLRAGPCRPSAASPCR